MVGSTDSNNGLPTIACVPGDPAGIGPEILTKLIGSEDARNKARLILVGEPWVYESGCEVSRTDLDCPVITDYSEFDGNQLSIAQLAVTNVSKADVPVSQSSAAAGQTCLDALKVSLDLCTSGKADAILFSPLNKHSLHLAGMGHADELHWFADVLGFDGAIGELNVLDNLWTTRVTSHVPLKDVVSSITEDGIIGAIKLAWNGLKAAGNASPRIGVAALNPHGGDNGSFGREEIDLIGPAVAKASDLGFIADGPYPADTVFVKAFQGDYDAVVTMYHDQGQIAMKLMGFDRGVTVQGGLPVSICTPGHGSAYDIAGKNVASLKAIDRAFEIACDMGRTARQRRLSSH